MPKLPDFLEQERHQTAKVLGAYLDRFIKDQDHLDPEFNLFLRPLRPYLLTGGKMARSTLVRLAFDLSGGSKDKGDILLGSAAAEAYHRFLLCHDDIIDQDRRRHGLPTLEAHFDRESKKATIPIAVYSQGMAMIAGDLIFSLSQQMVRDSGFNPQVTLNVLTGFHHCTIDTTAGWRLETRLKQRPIEAVSETEIIRTMTLVSAQYSLVWPLRFGQLFAGKDIGSWDKNLEAFSLSLGLAFQIQDDYLGLFGDRQKTGKPVGSDFREGKKTLILLKTWENAGSSDRQFLETNLGKILTPERLDRLHNLIKTTGALDYATKKIESLVDKSLTDLDSAADNLPEEPVKRLRELANFMRARQF